MRKETRTLSLAVLLFLFLICNGVDLKGQTQTTEPPIEIKISAKRFEFDPATITLPKGKPDRLLITSVDVEHGFSIKELGISREIKANETTIVEFNAGHCGLS